MNLRDKLAGLNRSAELWSWVFNFLRLASGLLLLPLLLKRLSSADLGMYYAFLGLVSLVPLVDNAFSFNISRFVGYAMGGARDLQPRGLPKPGERAEANHELIRDLLFASRSLYLRLSLGACFILGPATFYIVRLRVAETDDPQWTWTAAALTVAAAGLEVYSNWWNAFLRGMNVVRDAARIATLAYGAKLLLSCVFLIIGLGLAAVPLAAMVSATLLRELSRRRCLALLPPAPNAGSSLAARDLVRKLWPNSWRVGLQLLSGYLSLNGLTLICLNLLGLEANARFGLSWQVMSIAQGMASVWTQVTWPRVNQLRSANALEDITRLLRPRLWLQKISYTSVACGIVWAGQPLLTLLSTDKELLPIPLLGMLLFGGLLDMNFSFWTMLLTTENHVPSLRATVITNISGLLLATLLITTTVSGIASLILGPLAAGLAFNHWYWPRQGARSLRTTWRRFVFGP